MAMSAADFQDTSVLITGESGTGKENIARIIHFASKRKDNLFCAVNSGSITDSLLESEFFGHKKGSFTGALADRQGFFEISNQGTLFLDEIADMPMNLQAKMLRAIEEKKITRVGDTRAIKTDFRILSATNHDLDQLVDQKKFRLDLLHRLNTLHIHIPPLRDRPEDIEPLLMFFAEDFAAKMNKQIPQIDKAVIHLLKSYTFPGNVRELKNMTERAIILSKGNSIGVDDFPVKTTVRSESAKKSGTLNLEATEAEMIRRALSKCNNNQTAAAGELGIQRMALVRKMQKYNITLNTD
jgi:transcriptional regulator with PAS, ATPase and Fis domain